MKKNAYNMLSSSSTTTTTTNRMKNPIKPRQSRRSFFLWFIVVFFWPFDVCWFRNSCHTHTHKHRQIEPKIYDDGGLQIKLTEYTWLSCMYVTYILKYTVIDRSGTRIYNRQTHGSTYGCCTISKFSYYAI